MIKRWIIANEVRIAIVTLFVTFVFLFIFTISFSPKKGFSNAPDLGLYNDPSFWENIIVESHGMLLDLLIIGIFIFWLQKRSNKFLERENQIIRYFEELDDFRGWLGEEAAYRVAGIIKRLFRLEVQLETINFSKLCLSNVDSNILKIIIQKNLVEHDVVETYDRYDKSLLLVSKPAYLNNARLRHSNFDNVKLRGVFMEGADFFQSELNSCLLENTKLAGSYFGWSKLKNIDFTRSDLSNSSFYNSNLDSVSFQNANLEGADFCETKLSNIIMSDANLLNCKVGKKTWFEEQLENQITGLDDLMQRYYVDPTYIPSGYTFHAGHYLIKKRP